MSKGDNTQLLQWKYKIIRGPGPAGGEEALGLGRENCVGGSGVETARRQLVWKT